MKDPDFTKRKSMVKFQVKRRKQLESGASPATGTENPTDYKGITNERKIQN